MAMTLPDLAALVGWYAEMGVSDALDETARDHFAPAVLTPVAPGPAIRTLTSVPKPAARPVAVAPPAEATESASALAAAAGTLEALREALSRFEGCALKATAKNLVFADGNPAARLMLVGEAPGADEDRLGLPFVGKSGQLLDRMLATIGLDRREHVYIANVVPWRPPGSRPPSPQEAQICLPFIRRQIELANPDILVCVGKSPAIALLGLKGFVAARGRWTKYEIGQKSIRAMPVLSPGHLLLNPLDKRLAWRDLRAIRAALGDPAPRSPAPSSPASPDGTPGRVNKS